MLKTRILCLVLALAMCFSLVACGNTPNGDDSSKGNKPVGTNDQQQENVPSDEWVEPVDDRRFILSQYEYGVDYIDVYENYGKDFTIDMVEEDPETGLAYATIDGERRELGMNFLSYAMVYNTKVPEGGKWKTEDDVYVSWYKYYMTRWNYLMAEVPLYSNEYYDVYNTQIKGVAEHPTNPFWSPINALIDWTSEKEDNSIIVGNSTELGGRFRSPAWGVASPAASDNDINTLISGLETVSLTSDGAYIINPTVVESVNEEDHDDGSHTYTIKIKNDLKFSDGSAITAKNYLVSLLMGCGPVAVEAGGTGTSGISLVGYEEYHAFDGTNADAEGVSRTFSGVRLIDDYTFSVTVTSDYYPYYYAITYAGFSPEDMKLWLGDDVDIKDDGEGCYLTDAFYTKNGDSYTHAQIIKDAVLNTNQDYPVSGPYMVESYDEAAKIATLVINPNFKGNYEGKKPSIEKVVYKRIISETQLQDFKSGGVDVLAGITGGNPTDEALKLVEDEPDKYVATHYARAGYGKLGFRGDFGPTRFPEVRQAIAYCMDRATFAKEFTGGYGGVVDGAYWPTAWGYNAALEDGMILNSYPTSADTAIALLEANGWCYNADGTRYTGDGVRYKKLSADQIDQNTELNYASKDGAYKVEKVGDYYYMPLVINWYGTTDNEFTDMLVTGFQNSDNIKAIGMVVQNTFGDLYPMLDEQTQGLYESGYNGVPTYSAFNLATSFSSTIYDYSWNWTIDPSLYNMGYSAYWIKDLADAIWLK